MYKLGALTAWRITLLYAAIAGVWVILADTVLSAFISNSSQLTILHLFKDWIFVIITILLVYFLSNNELRRRGEITEALRDSEEKFRTLVNSMDDVVFTLDRQLRHTGVYGNWLEKAGLSPQTFLGKTLSEILGDKAGRIHAMVNERALAGEHVIYEWSMDNVEGVQFFQTSLSPLRDVNGEITGVVGVGRDITERKQAEAALKHKEEYYRTILENAFEGLSIIDRQAKFRYQSPTVEQILGFQPDELIDHSFFELIHPEDLPETKDTFSLLVQNPGVSLNTQNRFRHKDGSWRIIEARTVNLLDNPAVKGLVSNYRDITEQALSQQMLEQRVEERTHELSTLLNVSRNVVSTLELEALLDSILDQLKTVVDYTGIAILRMTSESDLTVLAYRGSLPQAEIMKFRVSAQTLQANPELFDNQKPVIIPDIQDDTPLARTFRQIINQQMGPIFSHIHSWLGVPLVAREQVIGLLSLSHSQVDHFSAHQAELAFAFANQVAVALENARLYAKMKQHVDELETLLTVQQAITSRLDPEAVLQLIADKARRLTNTRLSVVYLLDGDDLRVAVLSGEYTSDMFVGHRIPIAQSVAGATIQSGQPILVYNSRKELQDYKDITEHSGICCYITVPLLSESQPIGVIAVADKQGAMLGRHDEHTLTMLAPSAVIGLENARLYQKEYERRQALEALYRADEELYRHLHLNEVWQSLVDVAVDVLHVDKSATMVWDSRRERLVVQSARGFCPETMAQLSAALGEGLVDQVAANGEPVIVPDVANDPRLDRRITGPEEICSLIHVPIKINGQVFGVFNVSYDHPRDFSDEEQRLFTALAQRAALAIENARLYEQAQQTAILEERQRLARELHDAVTQNLFSASLITEVLPELWAGDPEEGQQLLKDLRLLSRGALAEMRTLLLELRPTSLAEASLGDLLRQLADAIMGRTGIPVKITIECDCKLPTEVRIGLYRIAQEALNNVAKHAHASQVAIRLQCYSITVRQQQMERVELLVEDNGVGFDPSAIAADHLGLKIMHERATAIEAGLMIESRPGQGTQITVTWPADQEGKSYE